MNFEERIWNAINVMKFEYNYIPTFLINMICEHGVVDAVHRLINKPKPTEGYLKLYRLNALNLSLESIILEKEWEDKFPEEDRLKAKKRLTEYGYKVK